MTVLLVTNDFPPRPGGIQSFVHGLAERIDDLVVYASTCDGAAEFDARQSFEVIRENTQMLLPTPSVARRAAQIATSRGCDTAWFGAAAPLGLLAAGLRRAGVERIVAQTHGHEIGWAALPGARGLLRRIARDCDVVTYLGEYTRKRLDPVVGDLTSLQRLAPGVDLDDFHPGVDGAVVRARYGLGNRPVIVCVSRLVPRKGQDSLIQALPEVISRVPDVRLLLVGGGPYESRLIKLAAALEVSDAVVTTGSVRHAELPSHYAAGNVFAMPCRTRAAGLDVEGLGIVFLEASAIGLPVVAGNSGGSPDAVVDGETGYLTADQEQLTDRLIELLTDGNLAAQLGKAGRQWVEREWHWTAQADRMRAMLTCDRRTVAGVERR
ncbi:MAG: glycosyltransferase family 4 protein [Longispora sp.]|nr:glycosyltransferase family 4 protein [Longispora sp. (in: high G+C Gram-positive bacteria)]